jgi:hypothetical protein
VKIQVVQIGNVKDARDDEELRTRPWGGSEKPLVKLEEWTEAQWLAFKYPDKPEVKTLYDATLEDIKVELERRKQVTEFEQILSFAKRMGVL